MKLYISENLKRLCKDYAGAVGGAFECVFSGGV